MAHLDELKRLQAKLDGEELPAEEGTVLSGGVVITDDMELVKDIPPKTEQEKKAETAAQLDAIEAQLTKDKTEVRESAQEEADLVVTSRADLEAIIKDIVKAYDVKIQAADNKIDQLALTIEMQEKKAEVVSPKRSSIKVTPRSLNVPDHQSILVDANKDKLKGKIGRFVNNRPDMRSLRRFQGYDPIIGDDGKEVRYMDGVLMGISKERHKEEIQKPREERKQFRAESIGAKFKEDAAKAGVEVIGDGITYDKEYVVPGEK